MQKSKLIWIGVIIAVGLLYRCSTNQSTRVPVLYLDKVVATAEARQQSLALSRENTLIVVVDPGCTHCQETVADLKQAVALDRETDIIFLAVNGGDTNNLNSAIPSGKKLTKTSLLQDSSMYLYRLFNYPPTPAYFIFNKGVLVKKIIGLQHIDSLRLMIGYVEKEKTIKDKAGEQ